MYILYLLVDGEWVRARRAVWHSYLDAWDYGYFSQYPTRLLDARTKKVVWEQ